MADNKKKRGSPDNKRINVNEAYEVRDWANTLNVSQAQLKAAVREVGTSAAKVRKYLKDK